MARKHGFRGTPVKPSNRPSSIGGIFERRGDPMVSAREGREKYGRNLETENPEMDRYFAEDRARERAAQILKPEQVSRGKEFSKKIAKPVYDPQKAAINSVLRMEADMRKLEKGTQTVRQDKASQTEFISCPFGCGYKAKDSRKVSAHLRLPKGHMDACRVKYPNGNNKG